MAKIFTIDKGYSGIRAGVPFTEGIGETNDPWLIRWFRSHGYRVEEEPAEAPKKKRTRKKVE